MSVLENWGPVIPADFFQEGARIEAAFRKYFHRAEPSQEKSSVDILVCHGNVSGSATGSKSFGLIC